MHPNCPSIPVRRSCLAATALLLFAFLVSLQTISAAELSAETRAAIDAVVERFMQEKQIPGLSAAIVVDHELCYERGYGLADVENQVPATEQTVYRLASISKMLTAVAALQLAEQGQLDLDAPVQTYVASFPEKQAPITCELLLKHQSGIRHYKPGETASAIAYERVSDAFGVFQDDPLRFDPGEKYSYTTYGYNLLGAAIEGAAGTDYVSYVQEHVCRPCGMSTIRPDRPSEIIPHRAAGYRLNGKSLENDMAVDVTNKIPGGGWCATPGDLARFAIALCRGELVGEETLARMWTPQKTASGEQTQAGYGCFVRTIDGDRRISHSGGQPKVATYLTFSPAQQTAVVVMCNLRGGKLGLLADELMGLVAPEASE